MERRSKVINIRRLMPVFTDDTASRVSSCSASVYSVDDTPKQSLQKPNPGRKTSNAYALYLLCLLNFLCVFDNTVMFTATTAAAWDIQGSTLEAFWTSLSVLLSSTISQPLWTGLSDILTRARLLTGAVVLLTLGSSLALLADSFRLLIAARTVQGVGIGGVVALTDVIILDCATSQESGTLFGVINSARALASAFGPVSGAVLPGYITWRWLFWINLPLALVALLAMPFVLRDVTAENSAAMRDVVRQVDWLGGCMFAACLTGVLLPLTWGGHLYEWVSLQTLLPLGLGTVGFIVFGVYVRHIPPHPLIRSSLFSSTTGIVVHSGAVVHGIAIFGLLFYLPLYYATVRGASATQSALYVAPSMAMAAVTSAVAGRIMSITSRYRLVVLTGWAFLAAGFGVLLALDERTVTAVGVVLPLVCGAGIGILLPSLSLASQACVSTADTSAASGMSNIFLSVGQTLGVCAGGVLIQTVFRLEIEKDETYGSFALAWARDMAGLGAALKPLTKPGEQPLRELVISAVLRGTRVLWLFGCVLSAVQFLASFVWVDDLHLDQPVYQGWPRPLISAPRLNSRTDPLAVGTFVRMDEEMI